MTYDAKLDASGDLAENGEYVTGTDLLAQSLVVQLGQGLGEWPLDTSTGIPYSSWIETLPAPLDAIEATFAAEITNAEGILSLDELTVSLDQNTREVLIVARATLEGGVRITVDGTIGVGQGSPSIPNFAINVGAPRLPITS